MTRSTLASAALIVALVIAAFGNVVFGGKSLVVSQNVNPLDHRYLPQNYGPYFVPPETWARRNLKPLPNYRDPAMAIRQSEPAAEYLRRSLLHGHFPFWDPYIGGGTPLFASLVPAMLFPPSLVVVALGNGSIVRNAYMLSLVMSAGLFTYALLRQAGLRQSAALTGGIAFAFSGAVIQTMPTGLGQPAAFMSLPLLATARLFDRPSARRAAEFALAAAFVALASFPAIVAQVFGTCVAYAAVASVTGPRGGRAKAAGWFAAGAATGIAIVAVAYIPSFLVVAESPQVGAYYATAALGILQPRHLMQLLSPAILGGAGVYANEPTGETYSSFLYYTGVVALFLAIAGVLGRAETRARPLKIAVLLAGGFAAAKVFGVPIVHSISYLPMLRTLHYAPYFGIVVAYAVTILAAFGVDALAAGRSRRWQLGVAAAAIVVALVAARAYAFLLGVDRHPEGWRWIADFRLLVLFAVVAVAAAFGAGLPRRAGSLAIAALVAILAIEGITNAAYPRQRRWNIWSHPPRYVEAIAEAGTGGRVQPMGMYMSNTQSVYGQPTLDSMTLFTSERMFQLYQRYFFPRVFTFLDQANQLAPERVLDAANVEFFVIAQWQKLLLEDARRRGFSTMYRDELIDLMRRPTAPRYYVTSDYVVTPPAAALEALAQARPGAVLVEQPLSFTPSPGQPIVPRVVSFEPNAVELDVETPRAGVLFCSESHMNGWTATIDGRQTPILHADFAFRAIEVPAGHHRVRLHYRPPGLVAGAALSAAGLIAVAVALRRRPAPHESAA